jgi:hypothetical protein
MIRTGYCQCSYDCISYSSNRFNHESPDLFELINELHSRETYANSHAYEILAGEAEESGPLDGSWRTLRE